MSSLVTPVTGSLWLATMRELSRLSIDNPHALLAAYRHAATDPSAYYRNPFQRPLWGSYEVLS